MSQTPKRQVLLKPTVIAIDGGSASGKSTTAAAVAKALGYLHVDSGALYRAVCWKIISTHINPNDSAAVKNLLSRSNFSTDLSGGKIRICIDGTDVPDSTLRTPEVTAAVSAVSAIPEVRMLVNAQLQALAETHNVVIDGRDIGTVVVPDAPCKFFLTASPEVRARRRKMDLEKLLSQASPSLRDSANQTAPDVDQVKAELRERDLKDSSRSIDPLKQADDAIVIDTTMQTVAQTTEIILRQIQKELRSCGATKPVQSGGD